jgi:Domain of unknown function (DUF1877)
MVWSGRAIDPSMIDPIRHDDKLLRETLLGAPFKSTTEKLKKNGRVNFSDPEVKKEFAEWAAQRQAEVGDTAVDLDKAWHGIHYLLTGTTLSNRTLASKVIMGGEDIGPDFGYGPAQLLQPQGTMEASGRR